MATTKQAPSSSSGKNARDQRAQLIAGLILLLFSMYLALALLSFLFTWQTDQSLGWTSLFQAERYPASNLTGRVGATLSSILVTHGFGIASFAIPVLLAMYALRVLGAKPSRWIKRQLLFLVGIPLASLLLGFLFAATGGYLGYGLGGQYGYHLANWLNYTISPVGAGFLLLLLTLAYAMWFNPALEGRIWALVKRTLQYARTPQRIPHAPHPVATPAGTIPDEAQPTAHDPQHAHDEEDEGGKAPPPANLEQEGEASENDEFSFERPMEEEGESMPAPLAAPSTIGPLAPRANPDTGDTTRKSPPPQTPYNPVQELPSYCPPTLELLNTYAGTNTITDEELRAELHANKDLIVKTLRDFHIEIQRIQATVGPTITLYEIVPASGNKVSKIKSLEDDLALSLAALGIRIIAPIPGRGTIGIEVPNAKPTTVSLLSCLRSEKFTKSKYALPLALGKTISNEVYVVDLASMPHLLVAGQTGAGKSVGLNVIIASLLYKKHPSQLKFVLVDPKMVELSLYSVIERHFLARMPNEESAIITETDKVLNTLNSLCQEMELRYKLVSQAGVRSITEYNEHFTARKLDENLGHRYLPYIVLVVDEFADLIMVAGREISMPITRLAQKARAVGIHLVLATQRPTTDIITGTIKANFPARIAFKVAAAVDSKTILDETGANQLVGKGDMLVKTSAGVVRVQCAFLDTEEVSRITSFIGEQPSFEVPFMLPLVESNEESIEIDLSARDALFEDVARHVVDTQSCSISSVQVKYGIGYPRSARIVAQLEAAGIVGKQDGIKQREVLVADRTALERLFANVGITKHSNLIS